MELTTNFHIIAYYVPYVELGIVDTMMNKTIHDSCLNKSYKWQGLTSVTNLTTVRSIRREW